MKYDIELNSTTELHDFNNEDDVMRLDFILKKFIGHKNSPDELQQIALDTTIRYIMKLDRDGFIKQHFYLSDDNVPMFDKLEVLDKAASFLKQGGYSKIYRRRNRIFGHNFNKTLKAILIGIISGIIGGVITYIIIDKLL